MKVTIERDVHIETHKTWFGFGSPRTEKRPFVRVTVHFSEEEKEIIKRAPLYDNVIYEHPYDEVLYDEWVQARQKWLTEGQGAGGYLGSLETYPRYHHSRLVQHFIEQPAHEIYPYGEGGDLGIARIEAEVEKNLHDLKELITNLSSRSAGKKEIEL